jgi:hypothetical protein
MGTSLLSRGSLSVFTLREEILGGVAVEGFLAAFRAEIVDLAVKFGLGWRRVDIDLHSTDGVFDHAEHGFLLSCDISLNVLGLSMLLLKFLCFCSVSRYTTCFFTLVCLQNDGH